MAPLLPHTRLHLVSVFHVPDYPLCVPTITDNAICIRHWDWSETSQTVSLFTHSHGVLRGIAKGSKRDKAPFSGGIELLTQGQLVAITKSTNAMATITAWDLQNTFRAARRSLRAFYIGTYLMDLIHHSLTDRDPHPNLFITLVHACDLLAFAPIASLLLGQWAVLVETGYRPRLGCDVQTEQPLSPSDDVSFSPTLGGLSILTKEQLATNTYPGWRVRSQTIELLNRLDAIQTKLVASETPPGQNEHIQNNTRDQLIELTGDPSGFRAARLLGSYLRHILGRSLPSMEPVFGPNGLSV